MKKSFKRALACLLAVLMVLFSMPFTAFATQINRNWWEASANSDGTTSVVDVAPGKLTAEPAYWGYNTGHRPEEGEEFGTGIGEWNGEMGPWMLTFGQIINYATDENFGFPAYAEDHRDDYKPVIGVTVSDVSVKTNYSGNKYYGAATTATMASARQLGLIKDPSQLKAGDKIAITLECGGFDLLSTAQFKGTFDKSALQPAYWMPGARGALTWTKLNNSSETAVIRKSGDLGCYGANVTTGDSNVNYTGTVGTFYVPLMGAGTKGSAFLGTGLNDEFGARPYGEYGIVAATITFEVLKDCDLSEVWHFTPSSFTAHEDGTYFEPYYVTTLGGVKSNDQTQWRMSVDSTSNDVFANAAIIWTDYTPKAEPSQHTHNTADQNWTQPATGTTGDACQHTRACTDPNCDGTEGATESGKCSFTTNTVYDNACQTGTKTYTCTVCGYTYSEDAAPTAQHQPATRDVNVRQPYACKDGLKDVETYCTVCGTVTDTQTDVVATATTTHTDAVKYEGETHEHDCVAGTKTKITYCSVCNTELNRETVTADAIADHQTATRDVNVRQPYACKDGLKDVETYCTVCGEVIGTEHDVVAPATTTHTDAVKYEGETHEHDCVAGTKTEITYCSVCNTELDRKTVAADPIADHTEATRDVNVRQPYACVDGLKDVETYCTVCGTVTDTQTDVVATATADHSYGDWSHDAATEKAAATHTRTCAVCGDTDTKPCRFTKEIITPATEAQEGLARWTCQDCPYSYDEVLPKSDCDHSDTVLLNYQAATCMDDGYSGDTYCNKCEQTINTGNVITARGYHSADLVVTYEGETHEFDCVAGTKIEVKTCPDCNEEVSRETVEAAPIAGHTEAVKYEGETHEFDCVAGTKTEITYCSVCNTELDRKTVAADPIADHTEATRDVNVRQDYACQDGLKDVETYCTVCGTVIDTDYDVVAAATASHQDELVGYKAPTVDEDGYTGDMICAVCGEKHQTGEKIDMLESYTVTVTANDMGTVTINGENANNGAAVKVAKEPVGKVTLVATPDAGNEFVGWIANGATTVSKSETFTPAVLANVTYTPVFAKTETASFTVTFVDAYGNVIDTQIVASADEIVAPVAPSRAGYDFKCWAPEISTITEAATVQAKYDLTPSTGYTVTATGCTIDGTPDQVTGIAYDTRVTVTAEGAKSWKIDGVTVAYGDTYSFYVGADVTVVPVFDGDDVAAAPTVANVKVTETTVNGLKKWTFLATRSMEGFKLVDFGFVYGVADEATCAYELDDVNGSSVLAVYCKTDAEQFSVTFGRGSQKGKVTARAFVAYVDGNGDTQVIYADAQTKSY